MVTAVLYPLAVMRWRETALQYLKLPLAHRKDNVIFIRQKSTWIKFDTI